MKYPELQLKNHIEMPRATIDWWLPLLWLIYDNYPGAIVINVMGFYERYFIRIAHLFYSFDHWSLS